MALINGYLSVDELREPFDDDTDEHEADYERAIGAASRQIDSWCSSREVVRRFWRDETPVPRLFTPGRRRLLVVGDLADTAGVEVRTDPDGDGTFSQLWDPAEWQAEPLVRPEGHPYTQLAAVAARTFPLYTAHPGRASVQVTARWGWAAVPDEVREACMILSVAYYKANQLTGTTLGFEELTGDVGPIGLARALVAHLHPDHDPAAAPARGGGSGGRS